LADFLEIKLYLVRRSCNQLGLKRLDLEYFTTTQIAYLKKHYQKKGDSELARIFLRKWPKQKIWTKKHIEKKRKYLSLYRTAKQIRIIHYRNVKAGCFKICPIKAWNKRGRAPEGEIRYWKYRAPTKSYPVIKQKGRFISWALWAWSNQYGNISKKMNVIFKDGDPYNRTIKNLALVSNTDLAKMNSEKSSRGLSDNYIAGILSHNNPSLRKCLKSNIYFLEIKRKQLTLNRTIYGQQNSINKA
jgi:HNH endonuclease